MSNLSANEERASWAAQTLEAYAKIRNADNDDIDDIDGNICDLLTDLRHYLATLPGDFADTIDIAARLSAMHFNAEQKDDT